MHLLNESEWTKLCVTPLMAHRHGPCPAHTIRVARTRLKPTWRVPVSVLTIDTNSAGVSPHY
jgi:hypothetical protein